MSLVLRPFLRIPQPRIAVRVYPVGDPVGNAFIKAEVPEKVFEHRYIGLKSEGVHIEFRIFILYGNHNRTREPFQNVLHRDSHLAREFV